MERKYPIKQGKPGAPKRFLRAFLQYVHVPSRASIFGHLLETHDHRRDLQLPPLHSGKHSSQHKVLSIGISIFPDGNVAENHKERLDYLVQNFFEVFSNHVPLSFLNLNPLHCHTHHPSTPQVHKVAAFFLCRRFSSQN